MVRPPSRNMHPYLPHDEAQHTKRDFFCFVFCFFFIPRVLFSPLKSFPPQSYSVEQHVINRSSIYAIKDNNGNAPYSLQSMTPCGLAIGE